MKLFIWDLHGTLEQGNELAVVELSNKIAEDFGFTQKFTDEDGLSLYGLRWYEYFEFLLPNEPHETHIKLQEACFDYSNSEDGIKLIAKHIKPSKNAVEVIKSIHGVHDQIVLSNTVPESLPVFLGALGILQYFPEDKAYAVNQHVREAKRTKTDVMNEYLSDKSYDQLVVIGDSDSDMQLAEDISAKAYLYAHEGVKHRSERGHHKISDLQELLTEL